MARKELVIIGAYNAVAGERFIYPAVIRDAFPPVDEVRIPERTALSAADETLGVGDRFLFDDPEPLRDLYMLMDGEEPAGKISLDFYKPIL